jgi:hypothetical protein
MLHLKGPETPLFKPFGFASKPFHGAGDRIGWGGFRFATLHGLQRVRLPAKRTKAGRKLDLPMTDLGRDILVARQSIGRDATGFVFPANSRSGHIEEPRFALRLVEEATGRPPQFWFRAWIEIALHSL